MVPDQLSGFRKVACCIFDVERVGNQTTKRLDMGIFQPAETLAGRLLKFHFPLRDSRLPVGTPFLFSTGIGHSKCFDLMINSYHTEDY